MALTTCPECNKQVSSQATSCPHCGFPLPAAPPTTPSPSPHAPNPRQAPSTPPAIPSAGNPGAFTPARQETYKELATIAKSAAMKLLQPFTNPRAEGENVPLEEKLLSFLIYADDFTETCCQQFSITLRRTSVLPEVRGTPTTALARQIRGECFAKTDAILAAYLEALKGCQIDLKVAAGRLQETSVLGEALRGAAVGQLAGGLGKTGATLGVFSGVIGGFLERERQTGLLWEQRKAQVDAQRLASRKVVEYLASIKQVTETLFDFGCAKCFGGQVDFTLQSTALAEVEKVIGDNIATAVSKAAELGGFQDDTQQIEEEAAKAPLSGISESVVAAVKSLLGKEARAAVIYVFKCQIGLKSDWPLYVAVTDSRVWFGGEKKGSTEIIQALDLPFAQLRFIWQKSKNTFFSGPVSEITLKWGGLFDIAILRSAKEQGDYFFAVLKRRVAAENGACVIS